MLGPIWNLLYLLGRSPWDTGITPPELVEVIESEQVAKGYALDIGCGTGTNAIYLAKHGFKTVGIDIAHLAIWRAQCKARRAGLQVKFHTGDVLKLGTPKWRVITSPVDFALDIGCLHALGPTHIQTYAVMLRRVLQVGGYYLLYAWGQREWSGRTVGVAPEDLKTEIGNHFQVMWAREGEEHGLPSYWYFFRRSS
jgi:cyclopropane fatty-acyl-phospholipid synthase-like methyltransferase